MTDQLNKDIEAQLASVVDGRNHNRPKVSALPKVDPNVKLTEAPAQPQQAPLGWHLGSTHRVSEQPLALAAPGATITHVLPVTQEWTWALPLMQQTVLMTAIRGPDNTAKYSPSKMLIRFYRRSFLLSALDRCVWNDPFSAGGGSFTGPSYERKVSPFDGTPDQTPWQAHMHNLVDEYLRDIDSIPHHYHLHLMHGVEILGYKHPIFEIREFWREIYMRFCRDMHVMPEPVETMDNRLGDDRADWIAHSDRATIA